MNGLVRISEYELASSLVVLSALLLGLESNHTLNTPV